MKHVMDYSNVLQGLVKTGEALEHATFSSMGECNEVHGVQGSLSASLGEEL
jgi:hypothetical protein